MKIALLFGGRGAEHDVSVASAAAVLPMLEVRAYTVIPIGIDRQGALFRFSGPPEAIAEGWEAHSTPLSLVLKDGSLSFCEKGKSPFTPDTVLSLVHGLDGEDGTMQGIFTFARIPFIGSSVTASAIAMNKRITKELVMQHGIPSAPFVPIKRLCEETVARITHKLTFPLFVKPTCSGSSVGVSRIENEAELPAAISLALSEGEEAIAEEAIEGSEIEVAVLERDGTLLLSPPGEIRLPCGFYDYHAKYREKRAEFLLPAPLSLWETAYVKQLAATVFRLVGCRDLARVDFLRRRDGKIFFNEINTLPGFTADSLFSRLFSLIGIDALTFLLEGRT